MLLLLLIDQRSAGYLSVLGVPGVGELIRSVESLHLLPSSE